MIVWITHAKVGHRQAPLACKKPSHSDWAFLLLTLAADGYRDLTTGLQYRGFECKNVNRFIACRRHAISVHAYLLSGSTLGSLPEKATPAFAGNTGAGP